MSLFSFCPYSPPSLCVYLKFPFSYKDNIHVGLGAHPLQYYLILTNYVCSHPVPNDLTF